MECLLAGWDWMKFLVEFHWIDPSKNSKNFVETPLNFLIRTHSIPACLLEVMIDWMSFWIIIHRGRNSTLNRKKLIRHFLRKKSWLAIFWKIFLVKNKSYIIHYIYAEKIYFLKGLLLKSIKIESWIFTCLKLNVSIPFLGAFLKHVNMARGRVICQMSILLHKPY